MTVGPMVIANDDVSLDECGRLRTAVSGSLDRPESVMAVSLSAGDLFRVGISPG